MKLFSFTPSEIQNNLLKVLENRSKIGKLRLEQFYRHCLQFYNTNIESSIPTIAETNKIVVNSNHQLYWIKHVILQCTERLTNESNTNKPLYINNKPILNELKQISKENTKIFFPKEKENNIIKKRTRNEEQSKETETILPPNKKQKINHTEEIQKTLFFIPISLHIHEIRENINFKSSLIQKTENKSTGKQNDQLKEEEESSMIIEQNNEKLTSEDEENIEQFMIHLEDHLFSINDITEEINVGLNILLGNKMSNAFIYVKEKELSDETLKKLTSVIIKHKSLSFFQSLYFIKEFLYPKIKNLSKPASRIFLSTLCFVCDNQPKQTIEGVLLETLADGENKPPINKFHVEILQRIISESLNKISSDFVCQFLDSFLSDYFQHSWNEMTINFLCYVLSQKYILSNSCFTLLLNRLHDHSSQFTNLLKFSSLLSTILAKYPTQAIENKELLIKIISNSSPKMKQSLLTRLNKLS